MPQNKKALTRIALLDRLLSNHRKAYSIQDMTDYLEQEMPNYGFKSVTRRCVEKDLVYLKENSPFEVEFERYSVPAPLSSGDGFYMKPCIRYADPSFLSSRNHFLKMNYRCLDPFYRLLAALKVNRTLNGLMLSLKS